MPEATEHVMAIARGRLSSSADSTQAMADAMKFELDELQFFLEFAKASETIDTGSSTASTTQWRLSTIRV